ncbi:hypothetical protein [Nodosilinea sp. E11]|uniref:hypothetical protein n=1 Tax=Nodosilinea sp. E11 TaxID=3037479 RepID=UPI0029346105|nr:hypothetical protein [Nodosilinea sp. E11]WOD38452.1 hypothetical protein RRF56_19775 [Nodosilinea sp. E11]
MSAPAKIGLRLTPSRVGTAHHPINATNAGASIIGCLGVREDALGSVLDGLVMTGLAVPTLQLLIVLARHRPFATFLLFADKKGHHYVNGMLIPMILPDSMYSTYRNYLNVMKTSFTAAASMPTTTTTTTIPTVPQQQLATSPSLLDGLLVYAPLLAVLGLGSIIAALITRNSQWQIYRDSKEREKESKSIEQTIEDTNKLAEHWQNYLANNSSLLYLEKDTKYYELIQEFSSSKKDELSRKLIEYKKKLNHFSKFEFPKMRTESKKAVKRDLKMFKDIIQPPADPSLESLLCSDYIRASQDDIREELERPLRDFLAEEVAKLKIRNHE